MRERHRYADRREVLIHPLIQCLACVFGASIICVDLIVQRIPSKRNFKIQDSDAFLSASLSLSFGVMVGLLHCFSGIPFLISLPAFLSFI